MVDRDYHSKGRYGAMAVVIKNGKIINTITNASTLPDQPDNDSHYNEEYGYGKPTIKEGAYKFISGRHNGYAALRVGEYYNENGKKVDGTVSVTRGSGRRETYSNQINVHIGEYSQGYSDGCLLVEMAQYDDFAEAVGFKKGTKTVSKNTTEYERVEGILLLIGIIVTFSY